MLVASLPGIRRASGPVPVTADVRINTKWLSTTLPLKATQLAEESPEPEIALTVTPGRRAACHSKYIPEARLASKDDLPDSEIATDRPISQYPSKMNPEATRPQARIHGISDRQENHANRRGRERREDRLFLFHGISSRRSCSLTLKNETAR
jgi:hypothetical protein